ncbi:MAG: RusA family crossover junction endodeoxyribonuclease [Rhodospirillales bacterium]|nr:RusA family crossover junction endodeoxyribonuclease [Rhodospirillales bacterium]
MIQFEIPVPLSINRTYKVGIKYKNKKPIPFMYLSAEAKAYKRGVTLLATAAANHAGFTVAQTDRLAWSLDIYPPNRRSDSDGGIKITKDAIASALGINDRCFEEDHTRRYEPDKLNPRAIVTVWHVG